MAYGGQPLLQVGSPVALVQNPSRHGVIRWLGTLPGILGTTAGVELDGPGEGTSDGTFMGHHYFTCRPGKAIFVPVTHLRYAPRIPQPTPPSKHRGPAFKYRDIVPQLPRVPQPTQLPKHGEQAPSPEIALQVQRYKESHRLSLKVAVRKAGKEVTELRETGTPLGNGSYGEVAEVVVNGRKCAAKKLYKMFSKDNVPRRERVAMAERFEKECHRVIYLSHPNIIEMIGIHFDKATRHPILVMELMDTSLCKYLEDKPKSSVPLLTKYSVLHDVASGLLYLHSLPPPLGPIIHRDLTANNILLALGREIVAKIADLGQAKTDPVYATTHQKPMLSIAPGNVHHMPPEACVEDPVYDTSLDVFSFGVVILHTLTHEWPEPDEGHLEVKRRKPHLDKIAGNPLKPLVTQCLSQDAGKRPTTSEVHRLVEQQYSAAKEGRGREKRESQEFQHQPQIYSNLPPYQRKSHLYDTVDYLIEPQGVQGGHARPPYARAHSHLNPPFVGYHMPYGGFPKEVTSDLEVGAPVELVQDPSRHGVIRWLGTLPGILGTTAGVELDSSMEGCSDGEWNGRRYFTCLPGRAFFCPVTSLRPDPRIPQARHPAIHSGLRDSNPLGDTPEWEEADQIVTPDQIHKYTGERRGIQGHKNSCYMDATIFALFALSDVIDFLFIDNHRSLIFTPFQPPTSVVQKEIVDMLWKGIVNPLRKNGVVRYESVMRLRDKLEELAKMKGVHANERDPEEFLNILFKHALHVDPFISIKRPFGTEPEFFVQLFVEFDQLIKVPTIGGLLTKMFREQKISFAEVPLKLLIQVPRYGKQFQTYKRIIPGIHFDTSPLMDNAMTCFNCGEAAQISCTDCRRDYNARDSVPFCHQCSAVVHKNPTRVGHKPERCPGVEGAVELELLSVLCIETSHYVCFSRDSEGRWLFFDSLADRLYDQYNIPRGVECTAQLNQWVYQGDQERLMAAGPRELPELVRRFTQDIYMCIYIQPDYGMYG